MTSIDENDARARAEHYPGWTVKPASEGRPVRLYRSYRFADFAQALAFVNKIGTIAEAQNHHPLIELTWGHVSLELWTHDCGGVSERDFHLLEALQDSPQDVG